MSLNIYLVRHSSVYNPRKLCIGQSEIPLAENFTVDFDWLKDQLNLPSDTLYFSSSFRRCTKLADFLSDGKFKTDIRLSELDFGDWEMKEWSDIPRESFSTWTEGFVTYRPPNGENFSDLQERAISFFEELCERSEASNVVWITHAGFIRALLSYVLEFPLEKIFNLQIDFSSITKLRYDSESNTTNIAYVNLNAANFPQKPAIGL